MGDVLNIDNLKEGDVMTGSKPCKKCKMLYKIKKGKGWLSIKCKCQCVIVYDSGYLSIVDHDLLKEIDDVK